MAIDPPDFLSRPFGKPVRNNNRASGHQDADSQHFPNNPLLMPFDGSQVQHILLNFQDTTSYLTSDNSKAFVGTVYGMCSMKEHNQKVQMNTANDLERDREKSVNPKLTLKSFQRSDAFRTFKPEDVRPALWCRRTVHYALCYFADADLVRKPYLVEKEFTYLDVYNFLRDRLRSIWQDLTVQRCTKHRGYIESFEISVRFLIYSNEVLCENEEYEVAQNTLLLNTCLDKLMDGYADVRNMVDKVAPSEALNQLIRSDPHFTLVMNVLTFVSAHEAEFWSYRLLLLIPQLLTPGCSATFCDTCQRMPEHIRRSEVVRLSVAACLAASSGNIYLYFKLMSSAECHPLQAALMNRFAGCVRVRFLFDLLANKIVKDSKNPFKFESLKQLLGFAPEPDRSMVAFLARYGVSAARGDAHVQLDSANLEMLAHDNAAMAKIAGKTQMQSAVVVQKFSVFKHRQLVFDPDFRAPFISPDDRPAPIAYRSQPLPEAAAPATPAPTSAGFHLKPPEQTQHPGIAQPIAAPPLVPIDSFGAPSAPLSAPAPTVLPSPTPEPPPFATSLTPVPTSVQEPAKSGYEPRIIKPRIIKPVRVYKPKLNEDQPHLHFYENELDFKKLVESYNPITDMASSKGLDFDEHFSCTRVEETREASPDSRYTYGFERFEREGLEAGPHLKGRRGHVYMTLDASLFYLERELNKYLNKAASRCILYSLRMCKRCNGSILRSERMIRSLLLRFKRTKSGLLRLLRAFSHRVTSPKPRVGHARGCLTGSLGQNLRQLYGMVLSKEFKFSALKSYLENRLEGAFLGPGGGLSDSERLSVFNPILASAYENLESIVSASYTQMLRLPRNSGNRYNPALWASGLFLHLSFFDLDTSRLSSFGDAELGNGLLQFKERAREYMGSDYCVDLKLDVLSICGFALDKEDLLPGPESGSGSYCTRMFQLVRCEYPYRNDQMPAQASLPVSLNVSLGLRSRSTAPAVSFKHRFRLERDLTGPKTKCPDFYLKGEDKQAVSDVDALYAQINKSIEHGSDLFRSAIGARDCRNLNRPQLSVFTCSQTLRLGHEDFLYNMYARNANVLKFRERLPLVDSLALLSFLLNSRGGAQGAAPSTSCMLCYRLSVSKLDILTLYNVLNSEGVCRCKLKSARRKIRSAVAAVNSALMDSLVDNARGFSVCGAEGLLRGNVTLACVGFEYEDPEAGAPVTGRGGGENRQSLVVSRLLYADGFREGLKAAWEGLLRGKRVRLLQRPVQLPDMHAFMLNLMLADDVTYQEARRNVQGLLAHSLQRFANSVILDMPESLWERFAPEQEEGISGRGKRPLGGAGCGFGGEYSKNGFLAMLVGLRECVKLTEFRMRRSRFDEAESTRESWDPGRRLRDGLSDFIFKVLDRFGVGAFAVPHALAFSMQNVGSPV